MLVQHQQEFVWRLPVSQQAYSGRKQLLFSTKMDDHQGLALP
jgi:hypothetical protein